MRIPAARVIAAAPDVAIGVSLLAAWIAPHAVGLDKLTYGLQLMLLEFIVIHSAAFMGATAIADTPIQKKILAVLGLGVLYTVFIVGFSLAFGDWWPVWAFWGLTLNRLLTVILSGQPKGEDASSMKAGWAISVALYLFWVIGTLLLPLPRLGIEPGMLASGGEGASGVWVDQPHRLLAAGAGYFLSQAYVELRTPKWARAMREAKRERVAS
jgi:hypothetical protein